MDHWNAAICILCYLLTTNNTQLTIGGSDLTLVGFCNSNCAEDCNDRLSISGYTFRVGGGSVSWQSKKQPTVSLSSLEAKYKALLDC